MLKPPLMIMSFLRSNSVRKPSASKRPTSPVRMKRSPCGLEPLGLARLRRLAVVADHHRARAADHLAGLAARRPRGRRRRSGGCRGPPSAGRRCAACPGCSCAASDAAAAAFGHAVELDQAARPARAARRPSGPRRTARWCRTSCGTTTGRSASNSGTRQQPLVLHRHQHGVRDAMPLGQAQVVGGVELGHQRPPCRPRRGSGRTTTSVVFE